MANPTWFIKEDYLLSKLAQLQKLNPAAYGSWNIVTVDEALKAAGYTNAYDHFAQFGALERTSPNAYFDANEYLAAKAAQLNAAKHGGRADWTAEGVALAINDAGLTPYTHFNLVGWEEGVNPSNKFDVNAYLASKAAQLNKDKVDGKTDWTADDVKAAFKSAGFDPISHYEAAGSAESITVTPAKDPITPPDVKGEVFTLTTAAGEKITGTAGNDEVRGVAGNGTPANNTLNVGDTIDGGAGKDTLNLTMDGSTGVPAGVEIKNIEVVNLNVTSNSADPTFLTSSLYTGVQELWQIDTGAQGAMATATASVNVAATASGVASATFNVASDYGNVVVGDGVTAGFKGSGQIGAQAVYAAGTVTMTAGVTNTATDAATMTATLTAEGAALEVKAAAAAQKVISIALDGVGDNSNLRVAAEGSGKIETVNVTGSIARESSAQDGDLTVQVTADTKTFNGAFSSGVDLTLGGIITGLEVVDLSKSSGAIDLVTGTGGMSKLKTLSLGSKNDTATVNVSGENDVVVDAGAGNDIITLAAGNTAGDQKATTITLGAGQDTVKFAGLLNNISDVTAAEFQKGLVTVVDFKVGEDTLNVRDGVTYKAIGTTELGNIAGAASLHAAVGLAAAQAGVNEVVVFGYGESTYVLFDQNGVGFDNNDGLVQLTGVSVADLLGSATSFIS